MNHKQRIVKRIDGARLNQKESEKKSFNDGLDDAQKVILQYLKEHEEMLIDYDRHEKFFQQKAPQYSKDLSRRMDQLKDAFYNVQDLLCHFNNLEK